jgi:hypothetical protein
LPFLSIFSIKSHSHIDLFDLFGVLRAQNLLAKINAKKSAKFTADKEAMVKKLKAEQAAAPAAL